LILTYPSSYNLNKSSLNCYKDLNLQTTNQLLNCNVDSVNTNRLNV